MTSCLRASPQDITAADKAEAAVARLGKLPHDPLHELPKGGEINLPRRVSSACLHAYVCAGSSLLAAALLAQTLQRALAFHTRLCTRYCLVCHNKLTAEYEALKPYVCDAPLCTYRYHTQNRGASLEYEIIHNPETVDLLVSLTYSAAAEGVADEPLPVGMALRVPPPDKARITIAPIANYALHMGQQQAAAAAAPPAQVNLPTGTDGLVDFDSLPIDHMRASIAGLIDSLPSIDDMKRHLERKVKPGKQKPRLKDMEQGKVLPAAWFVLRWCVASCTAYLEEMSPTEEQCIQGLDPAWRQFRFSVGTPDAEAMFQKAVKSATETDANAKKYPSLYAFHGSALRNWHSVRLLVMHGVRRMILTCVHIIRHDLWYRTVANGRALGEGVYLTKEAMTSMGHYEQGGRACWRKSKLGPTSCCALAEIVNLPNKFVSQNPHFVIKDTEWIMCRYLLVKGLEVPPVDADKKKKNAIPFVKLDPAQAITANNQKLQVPQPGYQIESLVQLRQAELVEEDHDATDQYIFVEKQAPAENEQGQGACDKGKSFVAGLASTLKGKGSAGASGRGSSAPAPPKGPPKDDWKHDEDYVRRTLELLMPPPLESSPSATVAVQRWLKVMLKEQDKVMVSAGGLKELGWYLSQDLIGDNLFQWIVEMHSFDETLPIAKDMKREFITLRFLPFMHGGGGHVTGGGSMCMDLLTSNGWLPSYSISAVLLQIRMAISNLDPNPARLARNWQQ
ncbi:hypothetical protein C8R43DRAFT_1151577 [Mycena crocata]|nr:hypothetical protein C8R43DRAFT_1151577 [Mycena crocata]